MKTLRTFWFLIWILAMSTNLYASKLSLPSGMTYTAQQPELEFEYFNTYNLPPDEKGSVENQSLPQSKTTYVYAQLQVKNLLYNVQDKEYKLTYKFILENGEQLGEVTINFLIKKEWEDAWYFASWGWEKPGHWPAGTHQVEVWINDTKFAIREFTITETKDTAVSLPQGEYYTPENHQLKFHAFNTYNLPPKEKGAIANEPFPQTTTTFVYAEIEFQNLLYQVRDQKYNFTYKYYFEDGKLLGEFSINFLVKKEWEYTWFSGKGGYDDPGKWPLGTHKVEVWINDSLFAIRDFSVVDKR